MEGRRGAIFTDENKNSPSAELLKTFRVFCHSGDRFYPETSELVVETPLEIVINNQRRILIMFTPQMVKELVLGFVFTEGLIRDLSEVKDFAISLSKEGPGEQSIEAKVTLKSDRILPPAPEETRVSYSSCGICGKEDLQELKRGLDRVKSRHRFSMHVLNELSRKIIKFQPLYKRTGGAHAAVLFDSKGEAIIHSEDMGRHNALDKVIGSLLIRGISSEDKILVSSGRASLEMILKTARAGFPVFVAMSRPTSRAAEAAKFYNITLIDFARRSNRIYTHARRIEGF